jgi:hypothetical protein
VRGSQPSNVEEKTVQVINQPSIVGEKKKTRRFLRQPLQIVRANKRPYLIINLIMYGLMLVGFGLALLFPELSAWRSDALEKNGDAALVLSIVTRPWLFALTILGVNVFRIGMASIVLPSMVVPFAGILVTAYWAFTTGMALVPTGSASWIPLIPHSLTLIIEFQAYIFLMLGAFILGRSWLRPQTVGAVNRRQGYLLGLKTLGWLAIPAAAMLIVGAIWEAFSLFAIFSMLAP